MNEPAVSESLITGSVVNELAAGEPASEVALTIAELPDRCDPRIQELESEISDLRRRIGDFKHEVAHLQEINHVLVCMLRDAHRNNERLCTAIPRTQVDAAKASNWDRLQRDRKSQLEGGVELDESGELKKTETRGHSDGFSDCPVRGIVEIGQFTVLNRLASDRRLLDVVYEDFV